MSSRPETMMTDPSSVLLSLEGLEPWEIATVGPCGHVLPLQVAVRAATRGNSSTAPAAEAASQNETTTPTTPTPTTPPRPPPGGGCPRCRAALIMEGAANNSVDGAAGEGGRPRRTTPTTPTTQHATATATIQSVVDGLAARGGHPHVAFRYKNCLYSLGVVVDGVEEEEEEENGDRAQGDADADENDRSSSSSSKENEPQTKKSNRPAARWSSTAQGRIASVLGLSSLKVLCRGKVVYPSTARSERDVSDLLLRESETSAQRRRGTTTTKVSLLVMGTEAGHELVEEPASVSPGTKPQQHPPLDRKALLYMFLLALQFGVQPILTRRYTPRAITRSTVVLMQEGVKFVIAGGMLVVSGQARAAVKGWTIASWFGVAFVPAALYSVQNMAALLAYQNLDALTFNVLNQTKTLSAALCCYLVMGKTQSVTQILALVLLLLSALVMEGIVPLDDLFVFSGGSSRGDARPDKPPPQHDQQWEARHWANGVLPVLAASFISGLAGALSQKNLQSVSGRNAYFFSMELCLGSVLLLSASLWFSQDGRHIMEHGFWNEWTAQTFVPIFTNSVGGIIVGLVTKYAGSVRKGFALIFGILLSGVIQAFLENERVSSEHVAGGCLAAVSLYLHAANPKMGLPSSRTKEKAE